MLKCLGTTGRILQREIIQIRDKKKEYKRMGERVPPELQEM